MAAVAPAIPSAFQTVGRENHDLFKSAMQIYPHFCSCFMGEYLDTKPQLVAGNAGKCRHDFGRPCIQLKIWSSIAMRETLTTDTRGQWTVSASSSRCDQWSTGQVLCIGSIQSTLAPNSHEALAWAPWKIQICVRLNSTERSEKGKNSIYWRLAMS